MSPARPRGLAHRAATWPDATQRAPSRFASVLHHPPGRTTSACPLRFRRRDLWRSVQWAAAAGQSCPSTRCRASAAASTCATAGQTSPGSRVPPVFSRRWDSSRQPSSIRCRRCQRHRIKVHYHASLIPQSVFPPTFQEGQPFVLALAIATRERPSTARPTSGGFTTIT